MKPYRTFGRGLLAIKEFHASTPNFRYHGQRAFIWKRSSDDVPAPPNSQGRMTSRSALLAWGRVLAVGELYELRLMLQSPRIMVIGDWLLRSVYDQLPCLAR